MPNKTALIVDDSKTAQFKLKKILDVYDLDIDCAFSAEDALSYLSYRIPDIIFMDHSMKGMNGLDAVRIIKSNPATVTIPVVMYTAESGDVYLSQARAIGAIDVLTKDVMTESDIHRVMKSINITPNTETQTVTLTQVVEEQQPATDLPTDLPSNPNSETGNLDKIRHQVAKSLDIQQGQMRRDIQDNTRVLINRFIREIRTVREDIARSHKKQREFNLMQLQRDSNEPSPTRNKWLIAAMALISVFAIYSFVELSIYKHDNRQLQADIRDLNNRLAEQNELLAQNTARLSRESLTKAENRSQQLLDALVWAINQKGQFRFKEQALGNERLNMVSRLVDHLNKADFKGTLSLEIHSGNFCVVLDDNGQVTLPPSNMPATRCQLLSDLAQNFDPTAQTSVSFINFLESSPIIERGDLKVDIRSHGLANPSYDYPVMLDTTGSDEWNLVASSNNRLTVSLRSRN